MRWISKKSLLNGNQLLDTGHYNTAGLVCTGDSILYRYPAGEKGHYKRGRTQVLKKLEKGVDKSREAWYSNQAVAAVSTAAERK